VNKTFFTNNRSPEDANLLPSKSKQILSDRFRICRNFTVRFGILSQPRKSGLVSPENLFKASQRKDSYGTILADRCRAVGVKVFQNLELFPDRICLCNSCARKIRNLGALFEVIRRAIDSESAVSQNSAKTVYQLV